MCSRPALTLLTGPRAPSAFTSFWLITRLIPNTNGARLSMMYTEQPGDERKCAKVYITGGEEGQGSQEGREVRWVKMETGEMRAFLEKEFGYKFCEYLL